VASALDPTKHPCPFPRYCEEVTRSREGSEPVTGPEAEQLVAEALDADVSESLKERAMDEAPVGITITDPSLPDNPMVYVNEAYERLTGYPREAVVGRNCRLLQGPETSEAAVAKMARAVDAGEPVTVELVNYRRDGSTFWNRVDIAPIYEDGEVTHFVGFQTDVTRRVRAEEAARERAGQIQAERRAMARVLDRVDGLLASVTDALVQATSREDLQRRVCRAVTSLDAYEFAWVGEYDAAAERVEPVVGTAGDGTELADFDVSFGSDDPVLAALGAGEVRVVLDAADREGGLHGPSWPDSYRSLAAVPLTYRESTYGVVCVYSREPNAFDDQEQDLLTALGRAVGTGVNALESHRRVAASERAELVFDVADTAFIAVRAARALDCELAYVGAERSSPDALTLLFEVSGGDADRVAEVVGEDASAAVVVDRGGTAVVEVTVPDPSLVSVLAERGASVASIRASPSEARLVVHAPSDADPRSVADAAASRQPGAELVAVRRESTAPGRARADAPDLTDRQRSVLRRAYASGYFDSPRAVSGEELAASMDLAPATFHQHLRAALRKVAASAVDADDQSLDVT
jgi:PAS domain S-box-containing protein